ncbi:MAG: hypothetical protein ACKVKV_05420 [Dehalococcoidia bacterium]|jgi:membrane-anchored protein YejM (alkaline phosphatase superfamily)|tara:strand:+ start:926 stop:1111 length:186 start_codon:yes stop_codon:yes gene_type:complete
MTPIPIEMTRLPLLHGVGGTYDEAIIFGVIAVLLIALVFLSWKASKGKDERRKKRKARRKR